MKTKTNRHWRLDVVEGEQANSRVCRSPSAALGELGPDYPGPHPSGALRGN
jgi:hypothetical protein